MRTVTWQKTFPPTEGFFHINEAGNDLLTRVLRRFAAEQQQHSATLLLKRMACRKGRERGCMMMVAASLKTLYNGCARPAIPGSVYRIGERIPQ